MDATHPDLIDSMWSKPEGLDSLPGAAGSHGYDFPQNDDDPSSDYLDNASSSHGTHCAGVIAAQRNNQEGISGASANTKIIALKIADERYGKGAYPFLAAFAGYEYFIAAKLAG